MFDDYKAAAVAASGSPSATTDILQWLKGNGPRDSQELKEIRKALYGRCTRPGYTISDYANGIKITGRVSVLFIASDKARHFLLRTLCKMNGTCPRRRR